jgi:mannitol-1-phosphate 5-dehydrogenase
MTITARVDPRKVVIFGAGATGRGHIGQLAYASGYRLVFVDKDESLVRELSASRRYTVRLVGAKVHEVVIEDFTVLPLSDEHAVAGEIASARLVLTAVLAENLPGVAKALSRGIIRRAELGIEAPLNVIACENMINGSTTLRGHVLEALDARYHDYLRAHVGFPNAMISRVVPAPKADRLLLEAEDYNEWPVDRGGFLGEDPGIQGLSLVDNLPALLERKLYMHNTGHAVCGYLAWLKGYEVMCEAIMDPWIQAVVRGAMNESGEALRRKHGFSQESIARYGEDFIPRVAGKLIIDPVSRVIRSPLRKVGRNERLIGPACMALDYGLVPKNLALGIAALLCYRAPDDPEAEQLQHMLHQEGLTQVLRQAGGVDLEAYPALEDLVQAALEELKLPI